MKRALAMLAVAALAACGGGGGSGSSSALPTTQPNSTAKANASATLTLRFPAHLGRVKLTKASGVVRKPAYINPNGSSLVITAQGNTLTDPSSGQQYFALQNQDPTTGISTVSIPLFSGSYNPQSLTITEYDGLGGGDVLAYGYNGSYTDGSGQFQSGAFTLAAGGTASPVVTMIMNPVGIVLTTDPVAGSDATSPLSPSPPGNNFCSSSFENANGPYYAFPIDATGTFVLPGQTPGAGYTGGDPYNFPGIYPATLFNQVSNAGNTLFSPTVFGPSIVTLSGSGTTTAGFTSQNGLDQISTPFGFTDPVEGWLTIGPGNC